MILLFCCTIIPSYASSWVQIDDTTFIDKDSIKTYVNDNGYYKYNQKMFWIKDTKSHTEIEKFTKKKVAYQLIQYIIDYSNNTITMKTIVFYTSDGKVIDTLTWNDIDLNVVSIVPNSIGKMWADLVKKPRILKKMYKMQQAK